MAADTTTAHAGEERLAFAPAEDGGPGSFGAHEGPSGPATAAMEPPSLASVFASRRCLSFAAR